MIGDGDVATILANGDFDTDAVFTISVGVTLTVSGWFTEQSDAVTMYGQVQVEAQKPTFQCETSAIATVRNKMAVTINSTAYTVERIEDTGMGVSVVYLKT